MKRIITILLAAAVLVCGMAGCAATNDSSSGASDTATTTTATISTFPYSEGFDAEGFWEGITATEHVELFDYENFTIPNSIHTVTDETLQSEINQLVYDFIEDNGVKLYDAAIVYYDTVNIDYIGSVDGVAFDNGSTEGAGTDVTIGVDSYIDDFLEQLIGHKPGDTFDVEVTFPDEYENESLEGKDAVFVTTINYITRVDLTDDFVAENMAADYGWETADAMKSEMKSDLEDIAIKDYIEQYMNSETTILSLPEVMVDYQERAMVQYYQTSADTYGMGLDEIIGIYTGMASVEELIASEREQNEKNAKFSLVCQAIAEDMDKKVDEEDLVKYLGTEDYAQYEEQFGMPYLKQFTLCQWVLDYIVEHSTRA